MERKKTNHNHYYYYYYAYYENYPSLFIALGRLLCSLFVQLVDLCGVRGLRRLRSSLAVIVFIYVFAKIV